MAKIKISDALLFQAIQEKFLLPNSINGIVAVDKFTFEISTDVPYFGESEQTIPIYERDKQGIVRLSRFQRVE